MKSATILSITIIAFVGVFNLSFAQDDGYSVKFCDLPDGEGDCYEQFVGRECNNVPEEFDDKISSLKGQDLPDGSGCVALYPEPNCQGLMDMRFLTGDEVENIPEYFDNQASSVRICNPFN